MGQVVQQGTAWMRAEALAGESPVKVTLAGLRRLAVARGQVLEAPQQLRGPVRAGARGTRPSRSRAPATPPHPQPPEMRNDRRCA